MWEAFAQAHPELNDELNRRAWYASLPYFAKDPLNFNKKNWIQFEDFLRKNQLLQLD